LSSKAASVQLACGVHEIAAWQSASPAVLLWMTAVKSHYQVVSWTAASTQFTVLHRLTSLTLMLRSVRCAVLCISLLSLML